MLGHLLLPEIEEMIRAGDFTSLRSVLEDWVAPDLAELIAEMPPESQAVIFRILPRQLAAETFEYLPLEEQESLLKALAHEQVAELLNAMSPDDRTALLEELPSEVTKRIFTLLSPSELATAKKLLGYPENSIGRLMTPDYVAVRKNWTVNEVLDHVRTYGRDSETLNVLYVVDDKGRLLDDIRVRDFLLSPASRTVSELMDNEAVALKATDDQEVAVAAFRKYDAVALPVTDSAGILVGIVTVDDVLDVAEEAATEDIQKLGGMEALEEPYMNVAFPEMVKKRARWLMVLFMGEMLTISAMTFFEEELHKNLALASFVPLIISSGGNSGSQAATLVIRALALGEVTLKDWWEVLKREVFSGLTFGITLGAMGFARVLFWSMVLKEYGADWYLIGATLTLTLVFVVTFGTVVGSMMPFILKRLGADPAASSTPFIATLVDVTGIVIYFVVASFVIL